ncbi:histidine kinase [Saccharopolyspora sp. NPDC049426]|uniref:GAF domain-containing sensor histidine kinase n=1 Tax=Saccharopolyspora sp. NPDC049426 TaxID=3155652 RepID=UPI003423F1E5
MSERIVPAIAAARGRLVEIGRLLLQSTETDEVLQNIASGICEATGYDRAVIVHYDRTTGRLVGKAGYGVRSQDVATIDERPEAIPIFADAMQATRPVVVLPSEVSQAIPSKYAELFDVSGPLVVNALRSDRFGVLGAAFMDRGGRDFDPTRQELNILRDYSDLAALSFQNALLFEHSRELAALIERGRIAADLHDGVTQQLFAAGLDIRELTQTDLPPDAREVVQRLSNRIDCGSRQLRAALFEVAREQRARDSDRSVMDAVRDHLDDFLERCDVATDLEERGDGPDPVGLSRQLVLRTVREGLGNIAKHADATQAMVILRRGRAWWTVEVLDDGVGEPSDVRIDLVHHKLSSFGLQSLANDAQRIGGRLWVSRAPGLGGLRVSVSVPVSQALAPPFGGAK